ncbi:MAG: NACHT domain-containing protein [Acidobacteria bacterium]|nr:NACHT domain-containing protein [Acidobacteriota bacterium]MYA46627.1 NACHT domain-containing protein [Acidobacteriota bacterium]MYI38467.1 NACHT domain-containing protein [Acidobacteriota bacterium]
MDYSLEQLGPERFQQICHALLSRAFPNTQCFPVGQPDGGRDAVSFSAPAGSRDLIVYQVKFVRRPLAEKEPHRWLTKTVETEAPKVQALVPKGATKYYLLTNVPGTAHPESGSIDSVQSVLDDQFSIPAQCWWRDDINRRLDDAWNIKWAYPEILSGPDILRLVIETGLSEHASRRTAAIRACVQDQFDRDKEVRFKQIQLENELLNLFIDVPVTTPDSPGSKPHQRAEIGVFRAIAQEATTELAPSEYRTNLEALTVGTASLLLHPLAQRHLDRVVIEGAPGQGKSTIVQYICQIHRRRILDAGMDDPRIPNPHRQSPVRLPFKVDCRDFATWLNRQDPFAPDDSADPPKHWHGSLESFLARQVVHHSGGAAFTVTDLQAVAKLSALLLVFDGLDEVADFGRRRAVVEEILKGVSRLKINSASIQTIVTSRPAALTDSPGLPETDFRHLHLSSIGPPLIREYSEKWIRARKLEANAASDVRRVLRGKLDQPHLRELAGNPMQLSILLSLIQSRGGSLPDKRTALYDSYVDLFFSREAEKSSVVRDHRDLLVCIHRYLGWVLHAEAQTKQGAGSANAENLHRLVEAYLKEEGHDASLAQLLFTGMVERVVALVSRVEGTYEFEVQPLREYFAARHLYDTAPYSPPGQECGGTLPDRFDALARDLFWQNVTRFYAGCYSKGELASLVDRLQDLARSPGFKYTTYAQDLSATLLSDWVFAQHPRAMKQVATLLLDGVGLRIAAGSRRRRSSEGLVLPKHNGNEELVEKCFHLLRTASADDYSGMLLDVVNANCSREEAWTPWWSETSTVRGTERTRWMRFGLRLGLLPCVSERQLTELLADSSDETERLVLMCQSGKARLIETDETRFLKVVNGILDRGLDYFFRPGRIATLTENFARLLTPYTYAAAFEQTGPWPLSKWSERVFADPEPIKKSSELEILEDSETAVRCRELLDVGTRRWEMSVSEWTTDLEPWNDLVESGRRLFGDRWTFAVLANIGAGIRGKGKKSEHARELHDPSVPLCERVRYARLRANAPRWWEAQLRVASDQSEVALALLVSLKWAGLSVFSRLSHLIDAKLEHLDVEWWHKLDHGLRACGVDTRRRLTAVDLAAIPESISERFIVALSTRVREESLVQVFKARLMDYEGDDPATLALCQRMALSSTQGSQGAWRDALPIISRTYAKGIGIEPFMAYRLGRRGGSRLPRGIAEEIVEHRRRYPVELVGFAERACRQQVAEKVIPVGTIAETEGWFKS